MARPPHRNWCRQNRCRRCRYGYALLAWIVFFWQLNDRPAAARVRLGAKTRAPARKRTRSDWSHSRNRGDLHAGVTRTLETVVPGAIHGVHGIHCVLTVEERACGLPREGGCVARRVGVVFQIVTCNVSK
jgi:hypothetical protein